MTTRSQLSTTECPPDIEKASVDRQWLQICHASGWPGSSPATQWDSSGQAALSNYQAWRLIETGFSVDQYRPL